jgi:phosphoesterase RecJ-like protein
VQLLTHVGWADIDRLSAKRAIIEARTIAIAGHRSPDGDSIGSMLSLGLGIEKLGKQVYLLEDAHMPDRYAHLPGVNRLSSQAPRDVDLLIAVDCASLDMLNAPGARAFERARSALEIDHHEFRTAFCDISLVDPHAAAVGEIIYLLLEELHISITRDIAENILASLIVETNSFRLPAIRPETFDIAAALLRTGVDFHKLTEAVFWSQTRQTALLAGVCLGRSRFLCNNSIVWSIITRADMKRVGAKDFDVDPLAEDLRAIHGVQLVVLFRERADGLLRVSLRSKQGVNIAALAERYGGGGHSDIAGCVIKNSRRERNRFIHRARQILDSHRQGAQSTVASAAPRWAPAYRVSASW